MLYTRDYNKISPGELDEQKRVDNETSKKLGNMTVQNTNAYLMYPKVIRHYESLFPNFLLDIADLWDSGHLRKANEDFMNFILNGMPNETDIKSFIISNRYYHIIGSLFKRYSFGHHGAFLFPEFWIGDKFRADYLKAGTGVLHPQ